jgi:hypothetical protein
MANENNEQKQKDTSGKAAGGIARAESLSPERRKEIASMGAHARHNRPSIKATHAGVLKIADLKIPCYVLGDGTRILSQRGLNEVFGITHGGGQDRGQKMPRFVGLKALEPFIPKELTAGISEPIKFTPPHGGNPVGGIAATVLADICNVWLRAREAQALTTDRQLATAQKAEILTRAFAHLGIIALIDEVTGYQGVRPQDALQQYLEMIIRKELAAWAKKFPDEFYENIYKIKGWAWPGMGKNRYSIVAHYTNDLVYERVAPGLLDELKKKNPRDERGQRKHKFHQWLTEDIGNPMLSQHLHSLIMFQRLAIKNGFGWKRFVKMVDQVLPKRGATLELPLPMPDENVATG